MKNKKLLVFNLALVAITAGLVLSVYWYFEHPITRLNAASTQLMQRHDDASFLLWQQYANQVFGITFTNKSADLQLTSFDGEAEKANRNSILKIDPLGVKSAKTAKITDNVEYRVVEVASIPEDVQIVIQEGKPGIRNVTTIDFQSGVRIDLIVNIVQEPVAHITQEGVATESELQIYLTQKMDSLSADIELVRNRRPDVNQMLSKTEIEDLEWKKGPIKNLEIQIGVKQEDCALAHTLFARYNPILKDYALENAERFLLSLCNEEGIVPLTCEDCALAPVDKMHKLTENYKPVVVETNLLGGGRMTPAAATALRSMFEAAEKAGAPAKVFSAYRSYEDQVGAFDYWYKRELSRGLPPEQAKVSANQYSAYPGHSEHQLGTTVDVGCNTCTAFDNSVGNIKLYSFIERNAHKYGFVVSYPKGTTRFTGYNYEPWHIRFVGEEIATELFELGYLSNNGEYLAKLLRQKGQY